ncbi:unnamed protein product [Moneuplotes crassus]|uniref:Uncharacterized protein n=2 Tax=Euplotes crassus TaxID=5936 RepID=A0AAD1XA90_EUPCR|nr:unnamed protein product [Moneuplotes crassus]
MFARRFLKNIIPKRQLPQLQQKYCIWPARNMMHRPSYNLFCTKNSPVVSPEAPVQEKSEFKSKIQSWDRNKTAEIDEEIREANELLILASSKLVKAVDILELLSILRIYSVYQVGDDKFYKKLHNTTLYKLNFMRPDQIVSSFMCLANVHRNPKINVDFSKFMNMALYKILKSAYSLKPEDIAGVVYNIGRSKLGTQKILRSYKKIIMQKIQTYNPKECYKVLTGWLQSGFLLKEDQEFLNQLLICILGDLKSISNEFLTELYYTLYGRGIPILEFEYHQELEEEIFERCHEFEFKQLAQVLATYKFMDKTFPDERFERALEDFLEKLIPDEVHYLVRYFYNDKVNLGLSKRIQERLEDIIREDASEMNSEELSMTYSALSLAQKTSPELLEYLEDNIKDSQSNMTLDSIIHLLNLKTQGGAEFFNLEKLAAPSTLKLLKQKNFDAREYTTIVLLFTALNYYEESFWREVLSYLPEVQLPDAISYMQLHSSLSVIHKQINIEEELKLLDI